MNTWVRGLSAGRPCPRTRSEETKPLRRFRRFLAINPPTARADHSPGSDRLARTYGFLDSFPLIYGRVVPLFAGCAALLLKMTGASRGPTDGGRHPSVFFSLLCAELARAERRGPERPRGPGNFDNQTVAVAGGGGRNSIDSPVQIIYLTTYSRRGGGVFFSLHVAY